MKATIGTVSHGTLRTEDLIEAFMSAVDDLIEMPASDDPRDVAEVGRIHDVLGAIERRMDSPDYFESEEAHWDLEDLTEILEALAPLYCYFGATEGDGSDFGFWPSWDALEELPKVSDASELDALPADVTEALNVNDHGNATLYARDASGNWADVWAIV